MRPSRTSDGSLDLFGSYTATGTPVSPERDVAHTDSGRSLIARRAQRHHERVLSGEVSPTTAAESAPLPNDMRIDLPATPGPTATSSGAAAPGPTFEAANRDADVVAGASAARSGGRTAAEAGRAPNGRGQALAAPVVVSAPAARGSRTPPPAGLPPRPPSPSAATAAAATLAPVSYQRRPRDGAGSTSPAPSTATGPARRSAHLDVPASSGNGGASGGAIGPRHGRTASMVAARGADGAPSPAPATPTTRLQFSAVRGDETAGALPPTTATEVRSVGVQTAGLNDGFIARRGTHMATPAFLLLGGPTLLLIGGVSYGHFWRILYGTTDADNAPAALSAYVAFLFLGFFLLNLVVFPMTLRVIASPLSTRSQKRYFRGASLIYGFLIALPMAMCELLLLNDSNANADTLGLAAEETASVFALVSLLTLGTVFVWLAYVNWMVDVIHRIVRKEAMKMIRREGVDQLHQRPGTQMPSVTKYAIAMSSRRRSRRSKSAATQRDDVQMGTVSRPLSFQSPITPGEMR